MRTPPMVPLPATLITTRFLSRAMLALRRSRSATPAQTHYVRYDTTGRGSFAQIWFATRGCSWDRRGSCTMCNYGTGPSVSSSTIVGYVKDALSSIRNDSVELDELFISPSGSLLDRAEVPDAALSQILDLVSEQPVTRFSFETRPDTLDAATLSRMRRSLPNKAISIGVGLESANPMTLRLLVNKPLAMTGFIDALDMVHNEGIALTANVCIGYPPFSRDEAVADAVTSARWALDAGADEVLLFPLHAKSGTLSGWLHDRSDFYCPSLWQLIDVIVQLPDSQIDRVSISWYRADYGIQPDVLSSPTSCPLCLDKVLAALDAFRARPSRATKAALGALDCSCRISPEANEPSADPDLVTRLLTMYEMLADGLELGSWWSEHSGEIRAEVAAEVAASPPGHPAMPFPTRELAR